MKFKSHYSGIEWNSLVARLTRIYIFLWTLQRYIYNNKNAWYVVPSSFGVVVKKTCGVTNKIFFVFYNFFKFYYYYFHHHHFCYHQTPIFWQRNLKNLKKNFSASSFFFPDGSQLVHPLAGFKILRSRGVLEYLADIFRIFLKVLLTAPSISGSGPSWANGNSSHDTFLLGFRFLGILTGILDGFRGGVGSLLGALLGVTGSLLEVTSLKILLSNFCCTGVTKSPYSSFKDFTNLVGSASTDNDAGSCLIF